ncbi:MAG: S9 family peptidase, partial [Pseudomonadota bacterium]
MADDARPTLDAPDDDPHLWLEEIEGEDAVTWAQTQTTRTLERYSDGSFERDRDILTALLDRPDNIPHIVRRNGHVYNFWTDAANPRGLWRRTTLDDYRTPTPSWETLI